MAAFKRAGSRFYWIGPFQAGPVDIPRMSTGQTSKQVARAMESALRTRALGGYADLVRLVAAKQVGLAEFYAAHVAGDDALSALRVDENDRPLSLVVPEYRGGLEDERARSGLDQLLALAPAGARLSWLKEPRNLSRLYRDAAQGLDRKDEEGHPLPRSKASVRRSLHRAISGLLAHELGRGQMLAIMADVAVPSAQDERTVMLSLEEVRGALEAAYADFRPALGLMVSTGIDLGALLRLRVYHYDQEQGTLAVPDTKTAARPRTLSLRGEPVLGNAEGWIRELAAGRSAEDPLLPLTRQQIRKRWDHVRRAIGRPDVRIKDLRGIFATYYLTAGGDPRSLQLILGHTSMAMTLRYLRRVPAGNRARLAEAASRVGTLAAPRLKVEKGGLA